jgi:hypothetical protein
MMFRAAFFFDEVFEQLLSDRENGTIGVYGTDVGRKGFDLSVILFAVLP